MQVTETFNQSLSRSYGVRVPAAELGALLEARIAEITPTLSLKGFRPGKVPAGHVRRLYGKALMGEVIEKTINETSQKVLSDHNLRVASQPDLKPSSNMDQVLAGQEDLTYDLEVEVMPDFDPVNVAELSLTRLIYRPTEAEVDEALGEVAEQNKTYARRTGKSPKAKNGDQLLVDFIGRVGGETFEGGSAVDAEIVLGAGRFIPGFEEQLVGVANDATVQVNVTFPEDYQVERLKGQAAAFEVTVKEVRAPKAAAADDALAQSLGLPDLVALREALRSNLEGQYQGATRFKLKRALLDALDARHDISLPPRMVEAEFESIWRQVQNDAESGQTSPEDRDKPEEVLRAEYRKIAERRVRLGLVLAEIGRRENVVVSDQELIDAMRAEAMKYGEMAQKMFDILRESAQAQANMRAPLYEEKVVDLIIGKATVTDLVVSKEELLKEDDLPEGFGDAPAAAAPAEAPKKTKARTAAVKTKPDAAVDSVAPKVKAPAKPRTTKAKPAAD
jgi:trigger factor